MSDQHATAEEIAQMTGWSLGYVRKLASDHQWRRIRGRPVRYHLLDVAERVALTRRRPGV